MCLASSLNKRQKINQAAQTVVFPSFLHLSLQLCCFSAGLVVPRTAQQQHKGSWQAQQSREGILLCLPVQLYGLSVLSPLAQTAPALQHSAHSSPVEPGKSLWPPEQGLSKPKHIQGQLWSWSLTQKLSAHAFLCGEEMRGFSAWLHSLLWAERGWQNPTVLLAKSPSTFSPCLQLPCLMMLHTPCCWWDPGPHPMGTARIQGPNRPGTMAVGSGWAPHPNNPTQPRGTRLSPLSTVRAVLEFVTSSCHHWHLSNEVTTLGTGTISKVDITLKKC